MTATFKESAAPPSMIWASDAKCAFPWQHKDRREQLAKAVAKLP